MEKGPGQVSSLTAELTGVAEGAPREPPVAEWRTWPTLGSSAQKGGSEAPVNPEVLSLSSWEVVMARTLNFWKAL